MNRNDQKGSMNIDTVNAACCDQDRSGERPDTKRYLAPQGAKTEDVAAMLVAMGDLGERLLVIIQGEEGDRVSVLPKSERTRVERLEPRLKGKLAVVMTEEQAANFSII